MWRSLGFPYWNITTFYFPCTRKPLNYKQVSMHHSRIRLNRLVDPVGLSGLDNTREQLTKTVFFIMTTFSKADYVPKTTAKSFSFTPSSTYRVSRRTHPSKFGSLSTNKANSELTRAGSLSDFQLPYAFRDSPVNIYLFSYKPSRP